jgi:hypothetical protein
VFVLVSVAVVRGQNFPPLPPSPPKNLPAPPLQAVPEPNTPAHASQTINASLLEKAFHLKMTKQKRENSEVVLIFEFTKTIDPDSLEGVRVAFGSADPKTEKESAIKPKIYLFDDDNVVLAIKTVTKTSGIITGRSGDAFRVHLDVDAATRKMEFRFDVEFVDETDPTQSRRIRSRSRQVPSGPLNINR